MIHYSKTFRMNDELDHVYEKSPHMLWAKEYCTIKFCMPRQFGHTSMIKEMFDNDLGPNSTSSVFGKTLVVFPTKACANGHGFAPGWTWVVSSDDCKNMSYRNKFCGSSYKAVIVDCSSCMSKSETDRIYEMFYHEIRKNRKFTFLFMG